MKFVFTTAACMSWELAESGKKFITSVVNATDLVPTFSAVSVDNLRSEVMLVSVHLYTGTSTFPIC